MLMGGWALELRTTVEQKVGSLGNHVIMITSSLLQFLIIF